MNSFDKLTKYPYLNIKKWWESCGSGEEVSEHA